VPARCGSITQVSHAPGAQAVSARPSDERRLSFGRVAELYEEARPSYPRALIEDVLAYAGLSDGDEILEVGAGTGKATRLFAAGGWRIVALEPSAEMAAVARRVCAPYPSVEIVESDFEHWHLPSARFRLLISAQAWHWTDPDTRYAKARAALRTDGALAVFWNHPDWQGCELRAELDQAYREAAPEIEKGAPMRPSTEQEDLYADWQAEIAAAAGFGSAEVRNYAWNSRHTGEQYVRLLGTASDHLLLEPATRERLLERIKAVIDGHGGAFDLTFATRLYLARAV
jgi:SAM-dependent methyltransferase